MICAHGFSAVCMTNDYMSMIINCKYGFIDLTKVKLLSTKDIQTLLN